MRSRGGWDGVCCGIEGYAGRSGGWCRRSNVYLLVVTNCA